ncbi:MAG: T9SS type A sorting domain-containing protein, partial [Sphingobacteriales bacterium]
YSFTDNNAGRNAGYYRIKAVSRDGQVQYSNIVRINAITEPALAFISVYPNPVVNKKTAVRFTNCAAGTYQVELLGSNGQVIFKRSVVVRGNDFTQQIVLPGITASGVYRLQAYNQGDKKIFATQLMIE